MQGSRKCSLGPSKTDRCNFQMDDYMQSYSKVSFGAL
jgi:hypothetical protein